MAEDLQWLTEKHYLVCPKGAMFKQMKVTSQHTVTFSGNLAATTADTMKGNVFICLGSMAFMAGAIAGLLVAALALLAVPVAGWAMAAIIGGALLLAIGAGYLKCKSNADSRKWINSSPNLIINHNEGLVVKQSKLCCVAENVMIDIKETFWEAMMSTTMHNVGHIANFAFGFLAGRGMGSMAGTAITSGVRAAGVEFLGVARAEMGNMFNPASLFGKMGWFCRAMRGFGMFGAYKGQYDIWTNPEMSTTDKLMASGQELILAIFAAKGASLVCFPAGTPVHTNNGLAAIETVAIGTLVWTMNEATGQREFKPVTKVHRRTTLNMMVLELENGTIFEVTPEHRFLVNNAWREIQEISALEELELIDGRKVAIKNIGLISKVSVVYNFDVADNENYFVTEEGVLVHNGYNPEAQDPARKRAILDEKGMLDVKVTKSGNPDFSESKYLYPDKQKAIIEIDNTGSRYGKNGDFAQANKKAGFGDKDIDTPDGYVWHHMDDYNSTTGKSTMQLVTDEAHDATKPHFGSPYQYSKETGTKYK